MFARRAYKSLLFFLVITASVSSYGACKASDIAGTWYVLVRWSDGGFDAGWNDCVIKANKKGKITSVNCLDLDLGETAPSNDGQGGNGKFQLKPSCKMTGKFNGAKIRGFVDRNVQVMNGVIFQSGVPNEVVTFSGVRK